MSTPPWPDDVFDAIFQAANGWSVRDYWHRCTLGYFGIDFNIGPWGVLDGGSHEALGQDRSGIIAACRRQAQRDGVPVAGYDHVVAFVHEPPADAGVVNGDAVLDQAAGTVERYHHEIGRLLGLGSAFGPAHGYCIMAPPGPASLSSDDAVLPGVDLQRAGRGLAAASLYRYCTAFRESPGVVTVDTSTPRVVVLTALSEATMHDTTLAVVTAGRVAITVEYRTNTGGDAGLAPAIVVHSIGIRSPGPATDPVWFEARRTPTVGAELVVLGLRAVVLASSPTAVALELSHADT